MLPFFRKIRYRLAQDNQFFKYSRYAIGEIVLVVVGILIALYINNWNEERNSEKKIDLLFEKVLLELAANINVTHNVIQHSKHHDTLGYLVLDNKLNFDDYATPKLDKNGNQIIESLFFPYTLSEQVFLNSSAYDNLLLHMDAIPVKYEDVVRELHILYTLDKKEIEIANMDLHDFVKDIKAERRKKYSWHSQIRPSKNIELIDYMLNSYLYKNEVEGYWYLNSMLLHKTLGYRNRAIRVYQQLAAELNKPIIHDSFKVDPEVIEHLTGTYKLILIGTLDSVHVVEQGYLENYRLDNNLIITSQPHRPEIAWENTLIDKSKTKYKVSISMLRNSGAVYMTYIREGDSLTVINNGGYYWKFLKVN